MVRFLGILLFVVVFCDALAASPIHIYEDKTNTQSPAEVLSIFKTGKTRELQGETFNPGFTKSTFWLIFRSDPINFNHKLLIGNSHINKLEFLVSEDEKTKLRYVTGDHFLFRQRPINNRLFIFPLEARAGSVYLIKVDKRSESLQLSVQILSAEQLLQKSSRENLITGILWGIIILVIVFVCFMYITVGEKLYLHYLLYLLVASLWIAADKGYGYQFLWPDFPEFASRARPVFNAILNIMIIQLMQSFVNQSTQSPFYKPLYFTKIASFVLALCFLFLPAEFHSLSYWFLGALLFLGALTVILVAFSLIEQIIAGNKAAWFYTISIFMLVVFSVAELSIHSGSSNNELYYLSNFGIQTGLVIEIIILNFGLAHRFNSYKNEKEALLIEVNKKQNELTERIIETQETERRKIADQLHDDVGSMLSLAILQISSATDNHPDEEKTKINLEKSMRVLGTVSDTIRNMSHTLTPLAIEKYGFKNAVIDLVASINLTDKIDVEHVILGFENTDNYSSNFLNDMYRISQELLNNIIKHSEASHCLIQLIEHEDAISIQIEDNGKGMKNDQLSIKSGMGISNIKSRVDYFKGQVEFSEKLEGGTLINIEIPIKGDES
ncbi:sensor histidine kinase [Daejeonella lutea]|uniref:histidine kinase n=1 Tax=Daejeonella lutea TaxID=572036 RepID=A0A1T5DQ47_9SPHI|nr:7TM diverse intracellular signaling domain-containing protein [Daejeonella lutea]SKB73805.1 Signal transduction histidine kinase [Daejeonella lutea]